MHTWNGTNSLSSKVARVSTEDFEKQAANAQRQAELLEHRLKTVIKKTAHHLPDAWKWNYSGCYEKRRQEQRKYRVGNTRLDLVMEKDVIDSIYYLVEKLLVDDADRCGASPLRDASLVAECPVRRWVGGELMSVFINSNQILWLWLYCVKSFITLEISLLFYFNSIFIAKPIDITYFRRSTIAY